MVIMSFSYEIVLSNISALNRHGLCEPQLTLQTQHVIILEEMIYKKTYQQSMCELFASCWSVLVLNGMKFLWRSFLSYSWSFFFHEGGPCPFFYLETKEGL